MRSTGFIVGFLGAWAGVTTGLLIACYTAKKEEPHVAPSVIPVDCPVRFDAGWLLVRGHTAPPEKRPDPAAQEGNPDDTPAPDAPGDSPRKARRWLSSANQGGRE